MKNSRIFRSLIDALLITGLIAVAIILGVICFDLMIKLIAFNFVVGIAVAFALICGVIFINIYNMGE